MTSCICDFCSVSSMLRSPLSGRFGCLNDVVDEESRPAVLLKSYILDLCDHFLMVS